MDEPYNEFANLVGNLLAIRWLSHNQKRESSDVETPEGKTLGTKDGGEDSLSPSLTSKATKSLRS